MSSSRLRIATICIHCQHVLLRQSARPPPSFELPGGCAIHFRQVRFKHPHHGGAGARLGAVDLEGVARLQRARLPPEKTGLLLQQRGGLVAFLPHAAFWGGAARALPSFANRQQVNPQEGGEAEGGVSPRAH
jgi:hypothetical protein